MKQVSSLTNPSFLQIALGDRLCCLEQSLAEIEDLGSIAALSCLFYLCVLLAKSAHFYLHICVLLTTPTDGVARIFP